MAAEKYLLFMLAMLFQPNGVEKAEIYALPS